MLTINLRTRTAAYHSVALSQCGVITVWRYHSVALSQCGVITVWRYHSAALSQCGVITVWRYHSAALSQCGVITVWRYHSVALSQCGVITVWLHTGSITSLCTVLPDQRIFQCCSWRCSPASQQSSQPCMHCDNPSLTFPPSLVSSSKVSVPFSTKKNIKIWHFFTTFLKLQYHYVLFYVHTTSATLMPANTESSMKTKLLFFFPDTRWGINNEALVYILSL